MGKTDERRKRFVGLRKQLSKDIWNIVDKHDIEAAMTTMERMMLNLNDRLETIERKTNDGQTY